MTLAERIVIAEKELKEVEETLSIIKKEDILVSYYGGGRGYKYITLNEEAKDAVINVYMHEVKKVKSHLDSLMQEFRDDFDRRAQWDSSTPFDEVLESFVEVLEKETED